MLFDFCGGLTLAPGTHEYQFALDGARWRQDPGNARQVGDYRNSVVVAGKR